MAAFENQRGRWQRATPRLLLISLIVLNGNVGRILDRLGDEARPFKIVFVVYRNEFRGARAGELLLQTSARPIKRKKGGFDFLGQIG